MQMVFSRHGITLLLLLLLGIVAGSPADGLEKVTDTNVTATMYDTRTSSAKDEFKGCYTTGCLPSYVLDGLLNNHPQSRWSCAEHINETIGECYITFDLQVSFILSELIIYFHKSNDTDRQTNRFSVSTSADNIKYDFSFDEVNVAGTPLLTGENFSFPDVPSGRYVRLTAILDEDQWLSINEVEIYVDAGSPSPTSVDTTSVPPSTTEEAIPSHTPTASPTESVKSSSSSSLTFSIVPTPTTTSSIGGLECTNVTVSNTEGLDGLYVWDSGNTFSSMGTNNATIESSQLSIDCADTTSTSCSLTEWIIMSEVDILLKYRAFDDAEHPALITEVWLRENCSDAECDSSPANIEIVCGETSTSGAPSFTPTPVPVTSTNCDIVEVEGTSGGDLDGIYCDNGSPKQGGVTQFIGYDDNLTSNGNTLSAEWVAGGCPCPSGNTTGTKGDCTWRQWSITPDSDNFDAFEHFTYDEADHPVDIAPGILWYTLDTLEKPYDGDINITCAPVDTLKLATPTPSLAPANTSTPTVAPSIFLSTLTSTVTSDDDGGGTTDNTPAIIGGVAGAAVVLALAGILAYRRLNKPVPLLLPSRPPPYNYVVGTAES